jgi:phosphoglucosamine mutase
VVSILSNGGLQRAVEAAGGEVVRTPVGDKYILEGMQVSGATLGGEKSGHVIVLEHTTSGDGIVTALEVLRVMTARGQSLADLAAVIPMLPQQQRAVRARHKDQWEGDVSGRLSVALDGLDERSRAVIRSRWLGEEKKTLQELADDYGVSAERIRQIEAAAITKLRTAMTA